MSTVLTNLNEFPVWPQFPAEELSCESRPRTVLMNFQEGPLTLTAEALAEFNITRYQVTKFYDNQIRNSGYYEQLKHIVEPTLKELESPGQLDTSGEHDNTVVPGLQHKYRQASGWSAKSRMKSRPTLRPQPRTCGTIRR